MKNKIINCSKVKRKTKENITVTVNESNIIRGIYDKLLINLIYGKFGFSLQYSLHYQLHFQLSFLNQ